MGTIPLIGGVSIYLSVVIGSVAFLELPETFIGVALICGLVTFIGALDDRYPLHAAYRLIVKLTSSPLLAKASKWPLRVICLLWVTSR
jgi:UDP-GlcNAc:undecaprenyl-phosphate GlcNAc-1-phosphate transferase